jgi:hypothetical protein
VLARGGWTSFNADEARPASWKGQSQLVSPLAVCLPQHPNQHRSERSGPPRSRSAARRRCGSWGSPVRPNRIGAVEVRKHEDVEQLGAGSRSQGIEPFTELPLDVLQVHEGER